jgi:hypothetical protein
VAGLVAVAACGNGAGGSLGPTSTAEGITSTTAPPSTSTTVPAAAATTVPSCTDFRVPVYASHTYPGPRRPGEPSRGTSLSFPSEGKLPDTDGDGQGDSLSVWDGVSPTPLVLRRGDGTVELVRAGSPVSAVGESPYIGDLDGDGHDDLLISAGVERYLVPGTVEVGSHDPADVGVLLGEPEERDATSTWRPVGDQNGDGADDLGYGSGFSSQVRGQVYSGRDLLALGPGASLAQLPAPLRNFTTMLTPLRLEADAPPAFVNGRSVGVAAELYVLTNPVICLRTDQVPHCSTDPQFCGGQAELPISGHVSAFMSGPDRIVEYSINERNHSVVWMWNLDQ